MKGTRHCSIHPPGKWVLTTPLLNTNALCTPPPGGESLLHQPQPTKSPICLPSAVGSSFSTVSSPSPFVPQSGPKVGSGDGELDFSS